MSTPQDFMEVFLQEASEHLQFLREYSGILQDSYPVPEDVERLYISAHSLAGTSATYGFSLFSEVSGKLAHIFQYAMNATIGQDAAGPLVEFISEAIAVLETDLLMISANNAEAVEDIAAFKERYPFAFPSTKAEEREEDSVVELATEGQHTDMGGEPAALESVAQESVEMSAGEGSCRSERQSIPDLEADAEVPAEILEFFVPEAEEHLQIVQECLLALEANPNAEDIHRLFRAMHTVKGSAAQVGLQRISRVAHRAEDLIGRLRDGELQPSAEIVDICLESVDALKKFLYRQWADEPTMQAAVKSLLGRIARLAPEEGRSSTKGEPTNLPTSANTAQTWDTTQTTADEMSIKPTSANTGQIWGTKAAEEDVEQEAEALVAGAKKDPTATPQSKSVRIALERLDRMMNAVGELVINRTRMLGRLGELQNLTDVLNFSKARMSDKVGEFQEKYEFSRIGTTPSMPAARPVVDEQSFGGIKFPFAGGYSSYSHGFDHSLAEFSELEMDRYDEFSILSRSLTEISADITEVLTQLDGFVRRVDSDIDEFTKLAHRLQDEITQARMVPIGNLYTRISRTVRDAAKATNKQVEVNFEGAETELDNNIIQQIADPLLHLVRNSVAHGIERTEERYNSGKSDVGKVVVRAYHRGNHIYIEVEDDGRGIDYDRVRQTAVESGLARADESDRLSERDLLGLLFHPGFSTAPRKTELAGRGVGLDVVRSNIAALNGEIEVESQKGFGSRFTLKVPLTLIISQALFVRCGDDVFAFPLAFVEEIRRLKQSDIEEVGGKLLTKVRDVVTEVIRLDAALGLKEFEPVGGHYRLVLVNVGGRQVGIVVEDVLRKDEIVIKNLGEYLRNVKLFPGATIAPDGSLILLVDLNRLVAGESIERRPLMTSATAARIFMPGSTAVAMGEIPDEAIDVVPDEKVVVLADDSISVRKFVGRMLEKAGYRVKLASDGLEALEIVTQGGCDLVVTDLEMPRTNGYELMQHMRQQPETRKIPVMVVTSRAGEKHRERAMKEGARAFLTKPVQEESFIAAIAELIGRGKAMAKVVTAGVGK
jgi:chemosensory pili system protein ChpA (sensor histidine kinase/response regulator)